MNALIFLVPEDIVDVRPKLVSALFLLYRLLSSYFRFTSCLVVSYLPRTHSSFFQILIHSVSLSFRALMNE
jgi:hypothetical protein